MRFTTTLAVVYPECQVHTQKNTEALSSNPPSLCSSLLSSDCYITEEQRQTVLWNDSNLFVSFCSVVLMCVCTCAEDAVPCFCVVLPCFGVEALVQLHRCDHHHAKCAHHLQRNTKRADLIIHSHWNLYQGCFLHPLPCETFVSLIISWLWMILVCPSKSQWNPSAYSESHSQTLICITWLTSGWTWWTTMFLQAQSITDHPRCPAVHTRVEQTTGVLTVFTAVMKFMASSLTFSCRRPNLLS